MQKNYLVLSLSGLTFAADRSWADPCPAHQPRLFCISSPLPTLIQTHETSVHFANFPGSRLPSRLCTCTPLCPELSPPSSYLENSYSALRSWFRSGKPPITIPAGLHAFPHYFQIIRSDFVTSLDPWPMGEKLPHSLPTLPIGGERVGDRASVQFTP